MEDVQWTGALKVYDFAMRVPVIAFTLFFVMRETASLRLIVASHPYFADDWAFFATVASRVSVIVFLVLLAALHALRRRPVRKYDSVRPKIAALLGVLLPYLMLLLSRAPVNPIWDAGSAALVLAGNIVCIVAVLDLGRSLSVMPEARQLVTEGLYGRIRHPLYLAEAVAVLGVFLQFRSLAAAGIVAAQYYFQLRRMHWEEGMLSSAFPDYQAYCKRSHRLIPGIY